MIIIPALNYIAVLAAPTNSPVVDVSEFESVRSMLYGSGAGTVQYIWSADGITTLYTDTVTYLAATGTTNSIPIRAKYLMITYTAGAYPNTLKVQHLFLSGSPSLSSLGNLGAGVQLYNSALNGIKSVVSDGSVSLSATGTQLTVSAANGMVAALNSDVQVAHAAGVFTVGIGQGAQRGANSLYITGTDTSASSGVSTNAVAIGTNGVGLTGTVGSGSVVMGYQTAMAGCGINSTLIGNSTGTISGAGQNKVAIGYASGYNNQGTQGTAVGVSSGRVSQGGNAVAVGCNAGYTGQGAQATAVGYNAGYTNQGNNSVAVGSGAGNVAQGANCVAVGTNAGTTQGTGATALGYAAANGAQPAASVAIGYNCAVPGAVGRLAFGNTMEAVAAAATAGAAALPANPVGFIPLEWNGVLYKIPVYNN